MKFPSLLVIVSLLVSAVLCSSCYRMPDEDEVSLIPSTNNPGITRENVSGPQMPSIPY